MNLNGQIDWSGPDRVVSNDVWYVRLDGDWWRETSAWQARADGSPALSRVSATRTRLTGLGAADGPGGVLVAETRALDVRGHATVARTRLDRAAHAVTRTTDVPGSSLAAVTVSRAGLVVSARSETGATATYEYDALGRQVAQVDGRGNRSLTVYDDRGRVAKTVDALGHETAYGYDALGRQTSVTDPLGNTVTTSYDAEGRVLARRGATYPVDYAYDAYGNRTSMTTYRDDSLAAGDTTRWLYDEPSGCLTNKVYADGKGPSYAYTPDGRLARRTWARGVVTDYAYDNAGQLVSTTYSDATPTVTMAYDRVGNMIEATTAGVVTNLYAYDLYGHCTNEWQNGFRLDRDYDTLGRSIGYSINGVRQATLFYGPCGRLSSLQVRQTDETLLFSTQASNSLTWTYLPGSDLKSSLTYPNGLTASWEYDANGQLLQVRNVMSTNAISQFDYAYDAARRRTSIARSGSAFGDLAGSVDAYAYNARSEVTRARRTKGGRPVPGFSEDFDYDPIGNRRSSSTYDERGEAQTSTYQANCLNQYTARTTPGYAAVRGEADPDAAVTVNGNPAYRLGAYYFGGDLFDNAAAGGLASLETYATLAQIDDSGEETEDLVSAATNNVYIAQSPEAFEYDDDGNQTLVTTKTGVWRVTYNGENRPVRWVRESDGATLVMAYDHMGRRRAKNDRRFFYDGYLQIADDAGNAYMWDPTEPVATRPLAWLRPSSNATASQSQNNSNPPLSNSNSQLQLLLYTHDGNKNVSEVISEKDVVAAHYEYAPFGEVILQSGDLAAPNPWRFSSEYAEDEIATVYYNYRHYESRMGRWLARDPIEEIGAINLFAFLENKIGVGDMLGLAGDSCSRIGAFNITDLSVEVNPADRAFSQEGARRDAEDLLRLLAKQGFKGATSGLGNLGLILRLLYAGGDYLSKKMSDLGRTGDEGLEQALDDFANKYLNGLFRVDGRLKYQLCLCKNGKLRFVNQNDLTDFDTVDFSAAYDFSWYLNEINKTKKAVEKNLLKQLSEKVKEAQGNE